MVPYFDYRRVDSEYCPTCGTHIRRDLCTVTCTTANMGEISVAYRFAEIAKEIEEFYNDITYKTAFFEFLKKIYKFEFPKMGIIGKDHFSIKKRYIYRMLFSKSGYLPFRVRNRVKK